MVDTTVTEQIRELMNSQDKIRNIAIAAHIFD